MQSKGNKPYVVIAIVILYVWQLFNFWMHQDLINHYLSCRQENVELRQKVLELNQEVAKMYEDILEPLERTYNTLIDLEVYFLEWREGGEENATGTNAG